MIASLLTVPILILLVDMVCELMLDVVFIFVCLEEE